MEVFRLEMNLKRTFTFTNGEVGGEALWAGGLGAQGQIHRGPVQDGFKELSTEQFCLRQSVSVVEEVMKIHITMQKITAV